LRICRFDDNRLGLVQGDSVLDVTEALQILPECRYPLPMADLLYSNLDAVLARVTELAPSAPRRGLKEIKLLSPVANPSKIIGAPVNYNDHLAESRADPNLSQGNVIKPIGDWGLFFKANSSLVGAGDGVKLRFPDRRTDHEAELVVIIGKTGTNIPAEEAMSYVAGYCVGLDMTVRASSRRHSVPLWTAMQSWGRGLSPPMRSLSRASWTSGSRSMAKRGRLRIPAILSTTCPSSSSLPPAITRCCPGT